MLSLFLCYGLLAVLSRVVDAGDFQWAFPTTTTQCQSLNVTVYGGVAPYSFTLFPLFGTPIVWNVTSSDGSVATSTNPVSFQVPLQLAQGTSFVATLDDSTHTFNFVGPTEVQLVGSGSTDCMSAVIATPQEFNFNIGGSLLSCAELGVYYQDAVGTGPYNMLVLPLDNSFTPFFEPIGSTSSGSYYWPVSLPPGTRFTVALGNADGVGTGGIAGAYQVGQGTGNCVTSSAFYSTGAWPAAVKTNTIGPLTASVPVISPSVAPTTTTPTVIVSTIVSVSVSGASIVGSISGSAGTTTSPGPSNGNSHSASSTGSSSIAGGGSSPSASNGVTTPAGSNTALIGGAAGGGAGALILIVVGIFLYFRKKKKAQDRVDLYDGPGYTDYEPKVEPYAQAYAQPEPLYRTRPYEPPTESQALMYGMDPSTSPRTTASSSESRPKSTYIPVTHASSSSYSSPQYIDHSDAEPMAGPSSGAQVIDVPPAYRPGN